MNRLLALPMVVALFSCGEAHAQSLKIPMAIYAGTAMGDTVQTYRGLTQAPGRFVETNFLLDRLSDHPKTFVVAGTVTDLVHLLLVKRFIGEKHPKIATVLLLWMSVEHVYFTAQGVNLLRDVKRQMDAERRGIPF